MAKQPYTEARKRANQKWDAAHKERRRSQARGFIRNFATMEDLQELQTLIKVRQDYLNDDAD